MCGRARSGVTLLLLLRLAVLLAVGLLKFVCGGRETRVSGDDKDPKEQKKQNKRRNEMEEEDVKTKERGDKSKYLHSDIWKMTHAHI